MGLVTVCSMSGHAHLTCCRFMILGITFDISRSIRLRLLYPISPNKLKLISGWRTRESWKKAVKPSMIWVNIDKWSTCWHAWTNLLSGVIPSKVGCSHQLLLVYCRMRGHNHPHTHIHTWPCTHTLCVSVERGFSVLSSPKCTGSREEGLRSITSH